MVFIRIHHFRGKSELVYKPKIDSVVANVLSMVQDVLFRVDNSWPDVIKLWPLDLGC